MKNISFKDRLLLEELTDRYTLEDLAAEIAKVAETTPESNASHGGSDLLNVILTYIKKLEGYRIRLREIHWVATRKSTHELSDSLMSILLGIEDDVAEAAMGLLGMRIKPGDIAPEMPEGTELDDIIEAVGIDTLRFRESIESVKQCVGIVSIIDNLIQELSKSKYLNTLE